MEATTNSSTELLLSSKVSYTRSLSHVVDELISFWSSLMWMCVNQFDARYAMVSWSYLSPLVHFHPYYLSLHPLLHPNLPGLQYVQLFLISSFDLSALVHHYDLHYFIFFDKMDHFLFKSYVLLY
ncbi:hypothetical protein GW17_00048890 [Ensete ventricosum]|nr:hypothetical protein GW17_00048890 [Ensete ventricosum]RZS29219.1 hypothetical protein BHM03_00062921 [Ensete ventricosum]